MADVKRDADAMIDLIAECVNTRLDEYFEILGEKK